MKQENLIREGKYGWLVLLSVLIITAMVFSGSLKLEWTNWDDNLLVYENPLVQEPNLKDIFTKSALYNTYNPLVILTFALEWKLVQDKPFLYHFNNLLLHIFCTVLVWVLLMRLGLSIWWSGFAALLFGIHPMRVESVAWITERKDVLYALFYLLALLAYIRFINFRENRQLFLTLVFFVLSLLSKGQAVAFPFMLVLLDWYFQRRINLRVIAEKAVFFFISLTMGLLGTTVFLENAFITTDSQAIVNSMNPFEHAVLGGYAFTVYIIKSIIPYAVSALYPIPLKLQAEHWMGALIAVVICLGSLSVRHKHRFITFGLLFFAFNILFLLMPFKANDSAFLNDRYVYVAYIGLFFIMSMSMQILFKYYKTLRIPVAISAFLIIVIFGMLTARYIPSWENSETLWTYVIEKYPDKMAVAHLNRGHDRYQRNQRDKALEDFNKAIEINPAYGVAYANRSFLYLESNENQKALEDYNRYMELLTPYDVRGNLLNSMFSDSYRHRGVIHFKMSQYEKALHDFNTAIEYDPLTVDNYANRALTYMQLGMCEKAIPDFTLCHQSFPYNSDILNNRGVCYLRLNNLEPALEDFSKAIMINGNNPSYVTNRAMVYQKMGRWTEATRDLQRAEKMKMTIGSSLKKESR